MPLVEPSFLTISGPLPANAGSVRGRAIHEKQTDKILHRTAPYRVTQKKNGLLVAVRHTDAKYLTR